MSKLPLILLALLASPAFAQLAPQPPTVGTTLRVRQINTGATLDVTAGVSPDGRYVGMNIHTVNGALDGIDTFGTLNTNGTGATVNRIPFRPAQVGNATFVENDKKLLTTEIPALTLENISLKAAAQKIADAAKTNITLGIRGLESAHVDTNAPHNFTIPAGSLKAALLALTKTAAPDTPLVITVGDNVIQIASQAQADLNAVTKTYYAEDLFANLPRIIPPTTQPSAAKTDLIHLITASVRPEIWRINGGKIADINQTGDKLFIHAPESVHALLDGPKHYDPNATPTYINYTP